jgi:thioredoxin reductase (NADPH)
VREFVVFSRRGCHLCEEMLEQLEPLCRNRARVVVEDVDTRPEWQKAYGEYIPVLVTGGREVCRYHLDREAVLNLLKDTD